MKKIFIKELDRVRLILNESGLTIILVGALIAGVMLLAVKYDNHQSDTVKMRKAEEIRLFQEKHKE